MEKLIQNKISFLHKRKHDASHHQGRHLENQSLDLSQKIILMGQEQGQGSFGFPFTAKRKHSPSSDLRLKRTKTKIKICRQVILLTGQRGKKIHDINSTGCLWGVYASVHAWNCRCEDTHALAISPLSLPGEREWAAGILKCSRPYLAAIYKGRAFPLLPWAVSSLCKVRSWFRSLFRTIPVLTLCYPSKT